MISKKDKIAAIVQMIVLGAHEDDVPDNEGLT